MGKEAAAEEAAAADYKTKSGGGSGGVQIIKSMSACVCDSS